MADRTPAWWGIPLSVVSAALLVVMAGGFLDKVFANGSRARDADRMEKRERDTKCRDARVLFFESCVATGYARWYCEVQWAQLRGQVWDSDPTRPWADQINCEAR